MTDYDCMFHDEGIPDAPCNCSDGKIRTGSHEIVEGTVLYTLENADDSNC